MFTTPSVVFALSVFNLLFCTAGLLFVYFDWNAARRREYLYLYFAEERPGYNYFSAARRRRTQFTRLLFAFGVLGVRQFLEVMLAASISQSDSWESWLSWLSGDGAKGVGLAIGIQPWLGLLEALGLALLGYALLLDWKSEKSSVPTLILSLFAALWSVLALAFVSGILGNIGGEAMRWAAVISRLVIVSFLIWALRQRAGEDAPSGLLVFSASTVTLALGAWLVAPTLGDVLYAPLAYPLGFLVAYGLLVMAIARSTLGDYESMELSRHRLGRERGVMFTFLKRLGAAFTTEVEVEQVLHIILESALETTEASAGVIYLSDPKTGVLEPRVVLNFFPPMYVETVKNTTDRRTEELEEQMRHQNFALGEGIIGEVAQSGHARLVEDVRAEGIMLGTTTEYMRNRSMLVVPLRVRDETLGVMAVLNKQRSNFGEDDQSLLQALADQASLSVNNAMLTVEVAEQERLHRDLQIARDIQKRLLPEHCPKVPGFEIAARGTSALEVGGDYYDFFWVDEDRLGIVVADVSGKGISAALVVASIRSAFRAQAPGNGDVRDVLSRVNTFISEDLRRDMFVTCVYGILEISTKKFSWARAGHEPIIVAHSSQPVDIMSPDGFALGLIGAPDFQEMLEVQTIVLHPGDRLLMFTDGLTEAMNSSGEEFGMDRILESLSTPEIYNGHGHGHHNGDSDGVFVGRNGCESLDDEEPEEMLHLEEMVAEHVGDAAQSDDLTIVYLAAI